MNTLSRAACLLVMALFASPLPALAGSLTDTVTVLGPRGDTAAGNHWQFLLTAESGSLASETDGVGLLVLRGVAGQVDYFSDHTTGKSGTIAPGQFTGLWDASDRSFFLSHPPALLKTGDWSGGEDNLPLHLLQAAMLDSEVRCLIQLPVAVEAPARTFGRALLLVDDAAGMLRDRDVPVPMNSRRPLAPGRASTGHPAAGLTAAAPQAAVPPEAADSGLRVINSTSEFDRLLEDAGESRIVLAYFWAAWCGPCRLMTPIISEMAAEETYRADVLFCKVDVDVQQDLCVRQGIRSIPSMMIFRNGQLIGRMIGAISKSRLQDFIGRNLP